MPTKLFKDGGEYTFDEMDAQPIHARADCGHVAEMGLLLVICKTAFRLSPEELDALITILQEAKERLIDQAVEFKAEADKDHDEEDD